LLLALWLVALVAACGRPSGPDFSRQQFQRVDVQLRRTVEAAERNDVNQAELEFFNVAHPFLHNLDLPLRNRGHEELSTRIFNLKNELEIEFAGERRAATVARLTREIRSLLPEAGKAMGAEYTPSS
jgi:hypothetical protein